MSSTYLLADVCSSWGWCMYTYTFLDDREMMHAVWQHFVKDINRKAVISPWTDLDGTRLLVERKELDVDRTETFVDRRRLPDYETVGMNCYLRD